MTSERLADITGGFAQQRIIVLGDYFLDKYLEVDSALAESSIETGKTAHQVTAVRHSPGAAGTVVNNLAALGCGALHAVGIIGDDGEGYELRRDLENLGCCTGHLHRDPGIMTPTYLKPRDLSAPGLAGEHNRYDTKNRTATETAFSGTIIQSLEMLLPQADAVIALDQVRERDCGVVTAAVREALAVLAKRYTEVIFWADSRAHIRDFRHLIIKANEFEAVGIADPPPGTQVDADAVRQALPELKKLVQAPVYVTCGAAGIIVSDPEPTLVPGVRVEGPVDITGAGDSATAGAVLALCSGASHTEAALIGNLVASITIRQLDTTGTASCDILPPGLALWKSQQKECGNEV